MKENELNAIIDEYSIHCEIDCDSGSSINSQVRGIAKGLILSLIEDGYLKTVFNEVAISESAFIDHSVNCELTEMLINERKSGDC